MPKGRKPSQNPRNVEFRIRMTCEERELLKHNARVHGKTMSEYIRWLIKYDDYASLMCDGDRLKYPKTQTRLWKDLIDEEESQT